MAPLLFWLRQPFQLLDTHESRFRLVLFSGLFGCLFLNIFHPFNVNLWFNEVRTPLFIILTFFSAAGMAALALSQFAVRWIFNVQLTTWISFLGWTLLEFFLIALAIHTVDVYLLDLSFFDLREFWLNLKHTSILIVLPYFLGILWLYVRKQLHVVRELKLKADKPLNTENVNICDEKGKIVITIPARNIVYFKSEDNYCLLYYRDDPGLKKELIRTNLKKLEQELDFPGLLRIHRSYMINSHNLLAAIRTSRGYKVKMDPDSQHHLPVSSTYQQVFEARVIQD